MVCSKCGKLLAEDSAFCQYCGTKVESLGSAVSKPAGFFSSPGNIGGAKPEQDTPNASTESGISHHTAQPKVRFSSSLHSEKTMENDSTATTAGAQEATAMSAAGILAAEDGGIYYQKQSGVKNRCQNCGAEMYPASKFCAVCGKAVNAAVGSPAKNKKNTLNKRKYLIAGISVAVCLLLLVGLSIFLVQNRTYDKGVDQEKADTYTGTETPEIDTAYPDAVSQAARNTITVEKAEEDLRENRHHECLDNGIVTFDKRTYEYPSVTSVNVIYWFDISVPWEYGTENYRAKVTYYLTDEKELKFKNSDSDCKIWQVDHQFTKLGVWQYDDGETSVWINFIERDGNAYVVEYEINYCAHYWSSKEQITYSTNGRKNVYGDNEWNGETYYLLIDLGDIRHEDGSTSSLGYIKVYPWAGVYWDALHVYGGPYRLHN